LGLTWRGNRAIPFEAVLLAEENNPLDVALACAHIRYDPPLAKVWTVDRPLVVWLIPSPKFHEMLLIETLDELGTTVNEIGSPAVPTLVEVATLIEN